MCFENYIGAAVVWRDLVACAKQAALWEIDPAKRATEVLIAHKMYYEWAAKSVLDIGCGVGRYALVLPYEEYTGIEQSLAMITVADADLAGKPNVRLIRARAEEISLVPNKFDLGIVMHVTQHLHDPLDFMRRIFELHQCKRWCFTVLTVPGSEKKYFNIGTQLAACAIPVSMAEELVKRLGREIAGVEIEQAVGVEEAREMIFWTTPCDV